MSSKSGGISQSNSGSMSGGMQAAIGDNNTQSIAINNSIQDADLKKEDVLKILSQISEVLHDAQIPESTKIAIVKYLSKVKTEIEDEEKPNKEVITAHLKRANENLNALDQTLDASQKVLDKVLPLLGVIWKWAGIVASYPVF